MSPLALLLLHVPAAAGTRGAPDGPPPPREAAPLGEAPPSGGATPPGEAAPLGYATLEAGDRAWARGDRPAARSAWRAAAEASDPAVIAMAELRLLLVSGTAGLVVHGPRADAALRRCPEDRALCALARADRELFPAEIGVPSVNLTVAIDEARRAVAALPAAANARLVWAGAAPLVALDPEASGLAAALKAGRGAWPSGPGTWAAGLAPVGGSGQGVGLGLQLRQPDLALRGGRLDAQLSLTQRGQASAGLALQSPPRPGLGTNGAVQVSRAVLDVYADGQRAQTLRFWSEQLWVGPSWRAGRTTWTAGPQLRWDGSLPGHGGVARVGRALGGPWSAALTGEGARGLALGAVELRRSPPDQGFAARLQLGAAPLHTAPVWRLPALGGGALLRSAPAGRWRSQAHAVLIVEQRVALGQSGLFSLVPSLEGALIDDQADGWAPHGGGGLGLRLALPPRPTNTLRLDAAYGDGGLGISAGWGQAF